MKDKYQMSETFLVSALLALSGGFQDAYTYVVRDEVFSNAQTGNVVLMSQHFMKGEWSSGFHYLFPIIAFALGVFIAQCVRYKYKNNKKIHWRQIIIIFEIIILFMVGFIPTKYNTIGTMLVSLSCAMQVQTFRKMSGYKYSSTMCIGNLRSGTESFAMFLKTKNIKDFRKFLYYYGIIFVFAIGAGIGVILSGLVGLKTIWICSFILIIVCLLMCKEYKK